MKAIEIMNELFALADERDYSNTCDTLKAGNPDVEVKKVAVSMHPTLEVVEQVKNWGAQLLIVHEPAYYNHMDEHSDEKIECEKRKIIEDSGITIYRYHDYPHNTTPDIIAEGQLRAMDFKGTVEYTGKFDLVRIHLDEPMTPVEVAKWIEDHCNIKHIRICGTRDKKCTVVSGMFGSPGLRALDELYNEKCEILLIGETQEWRFGEYARDADYLGYKKAVLILGHMGSERDGMVYTADMLKKMHPELEVKYFECGEVCTYTDS